MSSRELSTGHIAPFLLITFGLSWGILLIWLVYTEPLERLLGPIHGAHPLFLLATYAPAIAALGVVGGRCGLAGAGRFLSRLLLWRCPLGWYVVLLVGLPAAFFAGAAIKPGVADPLPPLPTLLGLVALRSLTGPTEELGWRGVLQPLLQRHIAPIWAALIVGAIWGLWHLPAFFLSGTPQSAWGFMPFLIGAVAVSVIVTGLFNASGGSILLALLAHAQLNSPLWPDAQPYDTWAFVALAVLCVACAPGRYFDRARAATTVVPPAACEVSDHKP